MNASAATSRPVRTPLQERAVRTREKLVLAAEREFSSRGYAASTARSIAERAGVATGSFYQYFPDKDALLRELAAERLQTIAARSLALLEGASAVRERVRGMVGIVVDYHREDPGLHAVITERRHADAELDRLTSAAEAALVSRIASLLSRWQFAGDAEATAFVLFGMIEGAVHAHVLGAPRVPDARFTDALVQAVLAVAAPTAV